MAIAASDFAFVEEAVMGPRMRMKIFTWTPSGTYTSGGEALTTAIGNALGFKEIHAIQGGRLTKASDGTSVAFSFDHNGTAGVTFGKFRVAGGGTPAHTHSILITGNQGAGTAMQFTPDSNSGVIGQSANVANRTLAGGASNILTSTAGTTDAELTAATDLTAYSGKVIIFGC